MWMMEKIRTDAASYRRQYSFATSFSVAEEMKSSTYNGNVLNKYTPDMFNQTQLHVCFKRAVALCIINIL